MWTENKASIFNMGVFFLGTAEEAADTTAPSGALFFFVCGFTDLVVGC
jgi:hypothetical protein